jgi:C-terminal processing protease CtpA/Prc
MTKSTFCLLLVILTTASCTKIKVSPPENIEVNDFVWKGLNTFYLWQNDVTNLTDNRFLDPNSYEYFLNSETNSAQFFENLLHQRNIIDKWSWIVEDYIALEKSFQGTSLNNGMEFGLTYEKGSTTAIFGYVRYVLPNTDASSKNIKRGMIFNAVNGVKLSSNNFRSLLFSNDESYTISLADYNNGNPVSNGTTITLTKSEYSENPVFITKTIISGNKKIGYLMYNSFTKKFDTELNAAFLTLKSNGITDLIIDLRYNGGGSVKTAVYLSSMITGQFKDQLFAKKEWNHKISNTNFEERFTNLINNGISQETINSLSLEKAYFITTNSSASASELVINGLKPYIKVKTIGTKTHGKYVGSITLYDSPQLYNKEDINTNHTWAMQPIAFEVKNKLGNNSTVGFTPNILLAEDYNNLGILGETSDPLLSRAITYITTGSKGMQKLRTDELTEVYNSKLALPTSNNMYTEFK